MAGRKRAVAAARVADDAVVALSVSVGTPAHRDAARARHGVREIAR